MTEERSSQYDWASTIKAQLRQEIASGGDLVNLPCPFCKLPRCTRSSYIRCQHCGINWSPGEDMSKDPHIERYKVMVESQRKTPKTAPLNS